jgi:transcription antitermination factor NusG
MAATTVSRLVAYASSDVPRAYCQPQWYAAYTSSNHEKSVAAQLRERNVEHFLPLYRTVHRWRDRRVRLEVPLFPGYLFVRLALRDRMRVLEVPSVVRLVGFGEHPAALPEQEIETLRRGFEGGVWAQPHPYLTKGRRVRIKDGPLAGLEGILLRRTNGLRVVISIELIMRSLAVEVDAADVMPQPNGSRGGAECS